MRNHCLLLLFFSLLTVGCKKELISTDFNKSVEIEKAKTEGRATGEICTIDTLKTGEIIEICKPANWNGELIIFATGNASSFEPLHLPDEVAPFIPLYTSKGYAWAMTSYSEKGFSIQSDIINIIDLQNRFIKKYGEPKYIYFSSAGFGGLAVALLLERYPKVADGGLCMCAPIGDFQKRLNYWGDFRVLFDYFFPNVLPGDAIHIPEKLGRNWTTTYVPAILKAIRQKPAAALKLLNIANAPYIAGNTSSIEQTFQLVLFHHTFFTTDIRQKLKGQPYGNYTKVYWGTGSFKEDFKLNLGVQRFIADKIARENVERYYQTTGDIKAPLVQMSATLDPVVPFYNFTMYEHKVIEQGKSALLTGMPVDRYGFCPFTPTEIVNAFAVVIQKAKEQK
ncbi:hypothetical protein [Segetibacter koreensis]|uniref:hypothetical protein n=1 Tax=Segetibacter koreensis TaxID=398037 RepID=UPI00035CAF15|nr:hypothetical protein [Segetibacter koreensis]